MSTYNTIFAEIMSSAVFRLDGARIDLTQKLIDLARAVHDCPYEIDWYLGESYECTLDSLIVGAYWAVTEWHGGQYSKEYEALSALGEVFSPNYSSGPEPDTSEAIAYELINEYYKEQN